MLRVIRIKYIKNHIVWVSLSDGSKGNVDLRSFVEGDLIEKEAFMQLRLDNKLGTIIWPNGKTFTAEFLKEHIARANLG